MPVPTEQNERSNPPNVITIIETYVDSAKLCITGFCRGVTPTEVSCSITNSSDQSPFGVGGASNDVAADSDPDYSVGGMKSSNRWIAKFDSTPAANGEYLIYAYNNKAGSNYLPSDSDIWEV